MLDIEVELDRSRFKVEVGVGIGVATELRLAEPGRGGGCMGVCFDREEGRDDPDRASVGVCGRRVGTVLELPFWASCAASSAR